MFGEMVEYWYYTGDTTYNAEVIQAMQHQRGKANNYEPSNQTSSLGNDDQMFWAFAAMGAAELGFENPADEDPSWLSLAQAVFNRQTARWDPDTCNGGLRWQMILANVGYDYKNSVTNLGLFQLSARLGRYTGNQTYIDWANKIWDWYEESSLYDAAEYRIWDGAHTNDDCTDASHEQWSYTYGILTAGMAYLYNHVSHSLQNHKRNKSTYTPTQTDGKRSMADPNRRPPQHHNRNLFPAKHGSKHHGRMDLRTTGSLQQRPTLLQSLSLFMASPHSPTSTITLRNHHAISAQLCKRRSRPMRLRWQKLRTYVEHHCIGWDTGCG
jgi:hypothetical protein